MCTSGFSCRILASCNCIINIRGESSFANTGTQCFFGVSDIATAKLVSEMAGTTTVEHDSQTHGLSESTANGYQNGLYRNYTETSGINFSKTTAHTSRRLMTPDEVMRMSDYEQIIFMKGLKPIWCNLTGYYKSIVLKDRSIIKPPQEIDFF